MRRPLETWRKIFHERRRRSIEWEPNIVDGVCDNGCTPRSEWFDDDHQIEEMICDEAEDFNYDTLWELGDMPVLKYNDSFVAWQAKEIEAMDALSDAGYCLLPWVVLKALHFDGEIKSDVLYYSQGSRPSCMGHADTFAYHSALLTAIGRGASLEYDPCNAIYTWAWSKNGSMNGGQSVSAMSAAANKLGHYPIRFVGSDNLNYNATKQKNYEPEAVQRQSAIMFLTKTKADEIADQIILACHAGLAVAVGNSTAVSGSTRDKNGIKVATLSGSWAHATSFAGYRKCSGTEYVGWVNSHGARYASSDEGEPADIAWMPRETVVRFASTMTLYGAPYIVFPEATWRESKSITPRQKIPFPNNFRR